MAQFSDVMRHARRMCESFRDGHCSECPIGNSDVLECGIMATSEMDCEEVEHRVMQWAEEHPEPVYPTWNEWYRENFPDAYYASKRICQRVFSAGKCCENDCDKCRDRPIPADIAEKLGIKPKEAK